MAIAGHVSTKMLDHYSHVRIQAKRQALDALSVKPSEGASRRSSTGGYDTNNGTSEAISAMPVSQLIEKNGGDDGTRTRDLCRDRAAF